MPSQSRRSKRASRPSRRSSRRPSKRSTTRKSPAPLPTLEVVLTYFFNVGAYAIQKGEPEYEPPTAKEFLQEVQATLRASTVRSKQSAGASTTKTQLFLTKLMGVGVGTFDTPCHSLLSYFAMVVWAAFFYTLAVSFFQLPASRLADAFANPVFAMLELLQGRIGSGLGPLRELKENIRTFVETTVPHIPPMAGSGIQQTILFLFNSESYKRLVEASLACLALRLGVVSCRARCNQHAFL